MVAIITNKFRFLQAQIFKDALETSSPTSPKHYLFVGRPQPWSSVTINPDLVPDVPSDTVFDEKRTWDNIMGLKRILPGNSSYVIPRWNWDVSGQTVYAPYSDKDPNLFLHPTTTEIAQAQVGGYTPGSFYVINQYFQVFKCLSNNGGAKSTVEPVADESNPLLEITLADGYTWKYMFTVQAADAVKYLSDHWIPVKLLTADDLSAQWDVQQGAANTGVIDSIQIVSGGSSYDRVLNNTSIGTIETVGPNQAIGAPASSASSINGWYVGATLWVVAGTGVGSNSKIISYLGSTKQFVLENSLNVDNTSQFQVLPTVTISGDGSGAVAKALVNFSAPNAITNVQVINPGSGYNYATATITGANSGFNLATVNVVLPPPGGHGSNPVEELGAYYVMINVKLDYSEGDGDFPISNDYRQIGIVRAPEQYGNPGVPFTGLTAAASGRLVLNGQTISGNFATDSIVTSASGASGWIIEIKDNAINSSNKDLVYVQIPETGYEPFLDGETVSSGAAAANILSQINPEVQKYTGDIIYFENRRPVLRAPDQIEVIKCIIQF